MINDPSILVVGAGASGLAFALECASRGVAVRIIDKRPHRSMIGKATGVAAGVWKQISKFGISPIKPHKAIPMRNFVFYDDTSLVANVPVPTISDEPPAYLLPQGDLERNLEDALSNYSIQVEYSTEFLSYEERNGSIYASIKSKKDSNTSIEAFDWIVGADGAHSIVRAKAKIPFIGREYPEKWSVAEISTNRWPEDIQAQLYLQSNGVGLFLSQPAAGIVQGIVNAETASKDLISLFPDAKLRYERHFTVALKRAPNPRKGKVWLIGDAAHVQSPVGGQGLNIAIWDGITLANGLLSNDQNIEQTLASRAKKVLFFTDFDYRMLSTKNRFIRYLRNRYWMHAAKHPSIAKWFFKIISGVW